MLKAFLITNFHFFDFQDYHIESVIVFSDLFRFFLYFLKIKARVLQPGFIVSYLK